MFDKSVKKRFIRFDNFKIEHLKYRRNNLRGEKIANNLHIVKQLAVMNRYIINKENIQAIFVLLWEVML